MERCGATAWITLSSSAHGICGGFWPRPSSLCQSCQDSIIATREYNFQEGQDDDPLTQGQVLDFKARSRSEQADEQQPQQFAGVPHPGARITRFAVSRQPDDIYDRDSPKDVIGRSMIREYGLPFLM